MSSYSSNNERQEWSLTSKEVKSVKGFENASEEDVDLIISTFTLLSLALFESEISEN